MTNNSFFPREAPLDRLGQIGLVISRVVIGYLWITQLLWKKPSQFGCPSDFAVTTSLGERTTGLCDWTGLMAAYSKVPLHGQLIERFVVPNIEWMGWLIWLMEAFIAISLILGLLSRLGGLLGLMQAVNLYIGLTALPFEWYWTYGMLITLQLIFTALPPGRYLGVDAWIRPKLHTGMGANKFLPRLLFWLT